MKPNRNAPYCVVSFYMPMSQSAEDFEEIAACLMFDAEVSWHMIDDRNLTQAITRFMENVATRCHEQRGATRMNDEDIAELAAWHQKYVDLNDGEGDYPPPESPTIFIP